MFDVFYFGPKPDRFAHEQPADSLEDAAEKSRTQFYWYIYGDNDCTNFDFDYIPPPWESEHLHTWPTQWHQHGGAYLANKDTVNQRQYNFKRQVVNTKPTVQNWQTLCTVESFDYSWTPHPLDPPYIYVFGNQWYGPEQMPTVEYHVPGATERKYLYEPQAKLPDTQDNWRVNSDIPVEFDFSWCPDPHDPPYIYVFGNQHWAGERSSTVEYHVSGATERKFVGDIRAKLSTLDIFYVDYSNPNSMSRYEILKGKYPHIQRIRYANSIMDTLTRCCTRSKTARFWVVSSKNNYTQFDFDWQPDPWQHTMTHVFPSQWNKWSDTFLINRWEFERHHKWASGIAEFPNLNFVNNQQVHADSDGNNIYYVDHGNSTDQLAQLQKEYPRIKSTRFVDNYLDTFKRIMATADTEYVWIINSVCDYGKFDFTWHPEAWQSEMIHVFPSGNQRRGDTFYIHVGSFKTQMYELELLDWFNVINYCEDQYVPRFSPPTVVYQGNTIIDAIKNSSFDFPYAVVMNCNDHSITHNTPCLWSAKDRAITPLTGSGSTSLVPREAKSHIVKQVYDYKYINKDHVVYSRADSLDVIFISNGESMAEENWAILKSICPRARRSQGITGRELAYKAAANLSSTPWFYAVFAKTQVLDTFNFEFQPDYYQEPKHYIFHSRNPLNGLEYGAMNVNLYNKQLVLDTDPGLDFTLSQAHEVVPVCISISRFNTDPWITWRSAFREVLKLKREVDDGATIEIEHRLKVWCTFAEGDNADYCLAGAQDALEFYDSVNGDYTALKQSFDWEWCQLYYYSKYKRKIWLETI
jgi:hypothetical protein